MSKWKTVSDSKIRHVWKDKHGNEVTVDPSFYQESGTPIDEDDGDDMEYVRTEILQYRKGREKVKRFFSDLKLDECVGYSLCAFVSSAAFICLCVSVWLLVTVLTHDF